MYIFFIQNYIGLRVDVFVDLWHCRSDEVEALDIDFHNDPMVLDLNLKSTFKESKTKVNASDCVVNHTGRQTTWVWVVVSNIFIFILIPGKMIQFDYYFSIGLKPPTSCSYFFISKHVKRHNKTPRTTNISWLVVL